MTKPTREQVRLLKDRFIHRTDVFAVQWFSQNRKEGGYIKLVEGTCPNDPPCPRKTCTHKTLVTLEPKHVVEHLLGKQTLGIYQLGTDDTVKWLCLDVDIEKGAKLPADADPRGRVRAHTRALAKLLTSLSLPFLVEDSGSKGYHLWLFFSDPVSANKAMALGRWLEAQVEPPVGIHVEVFPKQVSVRSFGNLVKLPLGKHRKTLKRCLFVGSDFEPLADQWGALAEVGTLTAAAVDKIIKKAKIELSTSIRLATNGGDDHVGSMAPPCMQTMMRDGVGEGARDVAAFKVACYLRDRGLPVEMAQVAMEEWNTHNDPPIEDDGLVVKVESAYSDAYSFFPCQERALDKFCDSGCRFYAEKMRKRRSHYRAA